MFLNAPAMTAVYGTHPLYGDTPRREFFYADNVATLEELAFPNNGLATIDLSRNQGCGGRPRLRNRRGTWIFGGLWGWLDPFQCHRGV